MKKTQIFALFLISTAILLSCTSSEDKAKKLIKEHLYKSLNDYNSYEPISYGQLDSVFTDYTMDSIYIKATQLNDKALVLQDSLDSEIRKKKIYDIDFTNDVNERIMYMGYTIMVYPEIVDSIKNNYNSYLMGLDMIHTFRAKTPSGGSKLCRRQYIFDTELQRIIKSIDIDLEKPIENHSKKKNGKEISEEKSTEFESKYKDEKRRHDLFFLENGKKTGVVTNSTGMQYKVIKEGRGDNLEVDTRIDLKIRYLDIAGVELSNNNVKKIQLKNTKLKDVPLKKGCVINVYVPYVYNAPNLSPYEITIMEVSVL